ncbi:MAG: type II secretion system secretin GspD [Myxococcales bacterium]|nr:type II secretion system secretin GspD [Myxococcota bacterium]MDW8281650.1 type II secretion system secretin GspD [Myxococcales bacterium]
MNHSPTAWTYDCGRPPPVSTRFCLLLGLVVAGACIVSGPVWAQDTDRGSATDRKVKRGVQAVRGLKIQQPQVAVSSTAAASPPAVAQAPAAPASSLSSSSGGTPGGDLPLPGEKEFTECRRIPPGKRIVVNLKQDSELQDLIGWIKTISCRPFIVPASIRQSKVTVIVPEAITVNEAYRIFLSALESMGLTVQPDGRVLKIIESNRARESSIPVVTPGERLPNTEQYVTRMLRLQHVTPEEVVQVLNRLKGRDGDITPYGPTNTLVITDTASNIKRMEQVVRALDVPMGSEKIWVIRLKNVVAGEVAQMLQQIFGVGKPGPGTSQPRRAPISVTPPSTGTDVATVQTAETAVDLSISQVIPDERTNSLILVATERTYQRVLALIRRLEQQGGELGSGGGRVHVYSLENANAEDLAGVLQGLGVSVSASGGRRGGRAGASPPAQPAPGGGAGGSSSIFQDEVKITADKSTNSLIILATAKDYLTLRDLIQRLDLPRRQVFIEATVMEVSLSKTRDLGLSYHGGYQVGDNVPALLLGGLQSGSLRSTNPLSIAVLQGLAAGAVGPLFPSSSVLGQQAAGIPSFAVLMQALQTNNDVNILQEPTLLTTDNEKAIIQVGQNLPFPSAAFTGLPIGGGFGGTPGTPGAPGVGGFGLGTSVQRQDVALKLEITPHVNASDMVRLEIDNEISDVAERNYGGLGPATNKRTLKTVAVVRDQQPVVLGGILRDSVRESVTKIPLLGDIPILGYLFKFTQREVQKQMLIIVLTPYIIHDPSDLRRIFERKMQERRAFLETFSAMQGADRDFDRVVDYSRKRGPLEEINRTILEAEREAMEIRAAEAGLRREIEAGPVELPVPPARSGTPPASAPPAGVMSTPQVMPPPPAPAR